MTPGKIRFFHGVMGWHCFAIYPNLKSKQIYLLMRFFLVGEYRDLHNLLYLRCTSMVVDVGQFCILIFISNYWEFVDGCLLWGWVGIDVDDLACFWMPWRFFNHVAVLWSSQDCWWFLNLLLRDCWEIWACDFNMDVSSRIAFLKIQYDLSSPEKNSSIDQFKYFWCQACDQASYVMQMPLGFERIKDLY